MSKEIKILINFQKFPLEIGKKHIDKIREASDMIKVEVADDGDILQLVKDAEVLLGTFNKEILSASEELKWIHLPSAGVDRFLFPELVNSDIFLTNSSGIHRTPISEMAIAMMLMLTKRLNRFMHFQQEKRWARVTPDELAGKKVGILGLGNIGMETARKAKCLETEVLALKKTRIPRPSYVDKIFTSEDLDILLQNSDFLIVTLPLTEETRHLIDEEELKKMKNEGYLINLSRGSVVNNDSLLKALKGKWIAGAALDVFENEPLPKESEFWELENVIITPHISGGSPHYMDRVTEVFLENLNRYLEDKSLINKVDKKLGY